MTVKVFTRIEDAGPPGIYGHWIVQRTDQFCWTATKKVWPKHSDAPIPICLNLAIWGDRKNGRLRPKFWVPSVTWGVYYSTRTSFEYIPYRIPCFSVADATRQADSSPYVEELVRRTVADTYSRANQDLYCRIVPPDSEQSKNLSGDTDPWTDPLPENPTLEPWTVAFRPPPLFNTFDLPKGLWIRYSWNGDKKEATLWRRIQWAVSGLVGDPKIEKQYIDLFPDWFSPPVLKRTNILPAPTRSVSLQPNQVSVPQVKALRERTGAGMADCRQALIEAKGNENRALEIIQKRYGAHFLRISVQSNPLDTVRNS